MSRATDYTDANGADTADTSATDRQQAIGRLVLYAIASGARTIEILRSKA